MKRQKLLDAIQQEDWKLALSVAKSFKRDFDKNQQITIQRAYAFSFGQSAGFFEQLNINMQEEYDKAIQILKDFYLKCEKFQPFHFNNKEFAKKIHARLMKEWGYDEEGNKIE